MDILVDKLFSIKDSLQDGMILLPQLLSGFFFLFGLLTCNIGMLCLGLGHFFIVPSLSFFANNEWTLYEKGKKENDQAKINALDGSKCVAASLVLAGTLLGPAWGTAVIIPIMIALKFILPQFLSHIGETMTLFDTLNPYVLFYSGIKKKEASAVDLCYLSPEDTLPSAAQRRSPGGWTIHLLFFTGFLLANAATLYSLPEPPIPTSGNPKIDKDNAEQIEILVNNRKIITGTILGLTILIVSILLYIQYTMTPCEDTIYESLIPMIFCTLFGVAWYTLLTVSCGIPASDILGLVQGFISPTAITNPIVCIGKDPGPLRAT